jgi:AraC-like DNA-binding protein
MIKYSFVLRDYEKVLKDFSANFGINQTLENFLEIPDFLGKGYAFAKNISPDISFVVLNFHLHDDLCLSRQSGGNTGYHISFNKVDISHFFKVKLDDDSIYDTSNHRHTIHISNPSSAMEATYSKGSNIQSLAVFYSERIAKQHLPAEVLLLINNYIQRKIKNVNDMLLTIKHVHLLNDILKCEWNKTVCNISNYVKIFQLTELALKTFFISPEDRLRNYKPSDLKALQLIEQNITQPGLLSFPSISSLAKTACMSPSKLKAMFKSVYGYSLYAYYNKNRMLRARDLMKDLNLSIKEVGYEIGYSNLSQFTAAFKKEFGITPKEYQRQIVKS